MPSRKFLKSEFHISHFRGIVQSLVGLSERQVPNDVLEMFHEKWFSAHCDDVRWFFLREEGTILDKVGIKTQSEVPGNLLGILERLMTFPTEQEELNAWWIEKMGRKPTKPKGKDNESPEEEEQNDDEEDDWRKFFDEETANKNKKNKNQGPVGRKHTLTLQQSRLY